MTFIYLFLPATILFPIYIYISVHSSFQVGGLNAKL
jgi:hypothetical protein